MHPVHLVSARTLLREFRPDDLEGMTSVVGDDRVTRWLSFDSRSPAEIAKMLEGIIQRASVPERTEYYLVISAPDDENAVLGFARLGLSGVQAAKLGYAVRADSWGRGYATDAVLAMVAFGFTELGLHRISATIGPDNQASLRIVEKLGFVHEGRIRDHVWTNGSWRDSELYSLLVHEWTDSRQTDALTGQHGQAKLYSHH